MLRRYRYNNIYKIFNLIVYCGNIPNPYNTYKVWSFKLRDISVFCILNLFKNLNYVHNIKTVLNYSL